MIATQHVIDTILLVVITVVEVIEVSASVIDMLPQGRAIVVGKGG